MGDDFCRGMIICDWCGREQNKTDSGWRATRSVEGWYMGLDAKKRTVYTCCACVAGSPRDLLDLQQLGYEIKEGDWEKFGGKKKETSEYHYETKSGVCRLVTTEPLDKLMPGHSFGLVEVKPKKENDDN